MTEPLLKDDGLSAQLLADAPMGSFGTPEEIAKPIVFLLSDDASYISGAYYNIDGGWPGNARLSPQGRRAARQSSGTSALTTYLAPEACRRLSISCTSSAVHSPNSPMSGRFGGTG